MRKLKRYSFVTGYITKEKAAQCGCRQQRSRAHIPRVPGAGARPAGGVLDLRGGAADAARHFGRRINYHSSLTLLSHHITVPLDLSK